VVRDAERIVLRTARNLDVVGMIGSEHREVSYNAASSICAILQL
jgi:hypothetical protein